MTDDSTDYERQQQDVTAAALAPPPPEAVTVAAPDLDTEPKPSSTPMPTPPPTTTTHVATTDEPKRKTRRRIVRRRGASSSSSSTSSAHRLVPERIASNPALMDAISKSLPSDYDFEIPKTLHKIEQIKAKHVALQLPEGLLMYACSIADILRRFSGALSSSSSSSPSSSAAKGGEEGEADVQGQGQGEEGESLCHTVSVLGDVTYGACCVDDLAASALGADLLVHYGHSCLVPIQDTSYGTLRCLYVFVSIRIDAVHAVDCLCETCPVGTRVYVMGTVQFRSAVAEAARLLNERNRPSTVPQAKPLSPGEVLGCTAPSGLAESFAPSSNDKDHNSDDGRQQQQQQQQQQVMLFFADGRFHLEAAMIANPTLRALRYDPYSKTLTDEMYETEKMKRIRRRAMDVARCPNRARVFGIILGTLGRQGNPGILGKIRSVLKSRGRRYFVVLLTEIFPEKLDLMPQADVWVQVACPRLSVDWGHFFRKPLLSAYELMVALGEDDNGEDGGVKMMGKDDIYSMDYYKLGGGPWTNYHEENRSRKIKA